jgi:hypothetical protein
LIVAKADGKALLEAYSNGIKIQNYTDPVTGDLVFTWDN